MYVFEAILVRNAGCSHDCRVFTKELQLSEEEEEEKEEEKEIAFMFSMLNIRMSPF